jgi:four helix bundle protein
MRFKHEDLEVFQQAMKLVVEVYKLVNKLPVKERYSLGLQLRRAVISIPLNIAEGSGKYSKRDFACFVRNSIGSLLEVDTCLKIGINLKYFTIKDYGRIEPLMKELYFKLIALHKSLK